MTMQYSPSPDTPSADPPRLTEHPEFGGAQYNPRHLPMARVVCANIAVSASQNVGDIIQQQIELGFFARSLVITNTSGSVLQIDSMKSWPLPPSIIGHVVRCEPAMGWLQISVQVPAAPAGAIWILATEEDLQPTQAPFDGASSPSGTGLPVFNVMSYGATGNGVHNDAPAIMAAIAAASVAGGTVFFPPGTYLVASTITVAATGVTLQGANWDASIIKAAAGLNADVVVLGNATNILGMGIRSLQINGNGTAQSAGRGLYMKNAGYSFVIDTIVSNAFSHGIERDGSGGGPSFWRSISVRSSGGDGYHATANSPNGIVGVNLEAAFSGLVGFDFQNVAEVSLANIFTANNTGDGFYTSSASVQLTGFYSQDNGGQGIDINGGSVSIAKGQAQRNQLQGVSFNNASDCTIDSVTVENSSIANTGSYKSDIELNSAQRIHISHCTLLGNVSTGHADYNVVAHGGSGHVVSDTYMTGAAIQQYAADAGGTATLVNNPAFNPQAFKTSTPGLPSGTGSGNAVVNTNVYPVSVYLDGTQNGVHIIDLYATDKALPSAGAGVERIVHLSPGDSIYFATAVPLSWLWYGE